MPVPDKTAIDSGARTRHTLAEELGAERNEEFDESETLPDRIRDLGPGARDVSAAAKDRPRRR